MLFKKIWLAGAVLAGGLAAGCADNDVDNGTSRQEGSLDSYPNARERTYSPIMGDTSGDGMRRDMRTGGVITGDDVPAREQLNEDTRTRINVERQRENTGPIRGNGSLNSGAPGGGANTSTGVFSGTERDRQNSSKGDD
jgi:hypothetical protein